MLKRMQAFIISLLLSSSIYASTTTNTNLNQQIATTTASWATAIDTHNVAAIDKLYAPDAMLYATYSNQLETPLDFGSKIP